MSTFDNGAGMEKPKTYKDYVIGHVYSGIMAGRYAAGEKIMESSLSLELGISRAPVREALRELVGEGLLDYRPQIGFFITSLNPAQIIDAYSTRGVLEGFAAAQAAALLGDDDRAELSRLVAQMERDAVAGRQQELVEVGDEFHSLILERCPNRQLFAFSSNLSRRLHVLFCRHWPALYGADEVAARHGLIVAALERRNGAEIEQVVRDHYFETGHKIAARQQEKNPS